MNLPQLFLRGVIGVYRVLISPALHFLTGPGSGCRFEPSCSVYAQQAVEMHGATRGSWLTVRRICRCHPWGGCGHDPVPGPATSSH